MSLCVVTHKHCNCDPVLGFPCPSVSELNDTIARERKRANDQWAAACMERESAEYWKKKAEVLLAALQEFIRIDDEDTVGLLAGDGCDLSQAIYAAKAAIHDATNGITK